MNALLTAQYDTDSRVFAEIPGTTGVAMRAFMSLVHPTVAQWLYAWLEWQIVYCPDDPTNTRIGVENSLTADCLAPILPLWRELDAWTAEDWNLARAPFIECRVQANMNLAKLWNLVKSSFRRSEVLSAVAPFVEFYCASATVHDAAGVGLVKVKTEAAMNDIVRIGGGHKILFADTPPHLPKESYTKDPEVRRDLLLFLVYSMEPILGKFARLPLKALCAIATPDDATLLTESRTVELMADSDIGVLHRDCCARADALALRQCSALVPLAFSGDPATNDAAKALLACLAMTYGPRKDDGDGFRQCFAIVQNHYAACKNALLLKK